MKFAAALLLFATGIAAVDLSPVTRVVQLLKGLQEQIEVENKKEEDLYETYVCWAKSVISSKTASNEQAKVRIDSLETYVSDLKAGRIELTSERVDLEKEISGLHEDMELAEAQRAKEKEDYEAAKTEMDAAIAALKEAIKVLEEATKDASLVSLHATRNAVNQNLEMQATQGQALEGVIALGKKFLSHGDALFLKRLIEHDVPKKDWKKLNRKADFKAKYKARSGRISKTLNGLLFTFSSNLDEAVFKEKKAEEQHKTLMDAKKEQLSTAQDALEKMELEGGARGMSLVEAESEIKNLKGQVKNDDGYIKQVKDELEAKKKEWKERQEMRSKEQEAVSKAIAILYSDDARDLFKKSFASQGYMLLQETQNKALTERRWQAKEAILQAARDGKDSRLVALASAMVKTGKGFDKVIEAIDKMLELLKKEEKEDLEIKEDCEKSRADDTREAIVMSREIDDLSDEITRWKSEIKEFEKEKEEKKKEILEIEKELKEATKIREEEMAEFKANKKDDEEAAVLVANAREVLATFYRENALLQQQPQFTSKAGEAPPPPPPTWSDPYKGKQEQSKGIVEILELIEEDIKEDITKAVAAEKEAQETYDKLKKESEKALKALDEAITSLDLAIGSRRTKIVDAKASQASKNSEVAVLLKKLKEAAPGCDFFAINFETRNSNRKMEMDGLMKAKAILKGAKYPEESELLQKDAKKHA